MGDSLPYKALFGPAQNILGPVKGQGINSYLLWVLLSIPFIKLPNLRSYKCQFCPQLQFVTAKNFSDHMLQVHNQKPFQCSDCSVAYMHKSNLEDHIRAKHVSGEPDIPCDKCGKMFRTKTSLFVHRREQVS